jgi:hypothetical protein
MTRHYGWAEVGHRLIDAIPHGHWNTSTFIAGLRCDGLVAPCVFDGAINGEAFLADSKTKASALDPCPRAHRRSD